MTEPLADALVPPTGRLLPSTAPLLTSFVHFSLAELEARLDALPPDKRAFLPRAAPPPRADPPPSPPAPSAAKCAPQAIRLLDACALPAPLPLRASDAAALASHGVAPLAVARAPRARGGLSPPHEPGGGGGGGGAIFAPPSLRRWRAARVEPAPPEEASGRRGVARRGSGGSSVALGMTVDQRLSGAVRTAWGGGEGKGVARRRASRSAGSGLGVLRGERGACSGDLGLPRSKASGRATADALGSGRCRGVASARCAPLETQGGSPTVDEKLTRCWMAEAERSPLASAKRDRGENLANLEL
ncbi:hypothetical protein AB1Y20_015885 [Prymnesium parvum]|uniref:Uncharacterized protein n=1 Tax=Prymnesium parvum TaxID=97485 RepID=A0AB34K2R4_PRYPA